MPAPEMYSVRVSFEASDEPDAVERMLEGFGNDGPFLARPTAVYGDNGYAVVEFADVDADPATVPASADYRTPGSEAVAALEGFQHEHTAIVPLMRALLSTLAVRHAVGLPPRRRLRVEVVPERPPSQDSVSSHRSNAAAAPAPRFDDERAAG